MSDQPVLPRGEFNMPPGVRSSDIPGNSGDVEVECPSCELAFYISEVVENLNLCPECGQDLTNFL